MSLHIIPDLKTQRWVISFMTLVLTQQKESPKRFSITSLQSPLALKPETQLQKDPVKERAKPAKCKSSFCWDVFPLENPFFLLHTLILRLLGSLCEKLCAYKKGFRGWSLKAALGTENTWQIVSLNLSSSIDFRDYIYMIPAESQHQRAHPWPVILGFAVDELSFQAFPPG